ncbi:hypothetical protein GOV09_01170 [Candidatus Woesearchaeota archaeon]|nr:hypothetical protein [Candidatus Woesearchaeota archaeon]
MGMFKKALGYAGKVTGSIGKAAEYVSRKWHEKDEFSVPWMQNKDMTLPTKPKASLLLEEIAQRSGRSGDEVKRAVGEGILEPFREGENLRFPEEDISTLQGTLPWDPEYTYCHTLEKASRLSKRSVEEIKRAISSGDEIGYRDGSAFKFSDQDISKLKGQLSWEVPLEETVQTLRALGMKSGRLKKRKVHGKIYFDKEEMNDLRKQSGILSKKELSRYTKIPEDKLEQVLDKEEHASVHVAGQTFYGSRVRDRLIRQPIDGEVSYHLADKKLAEIGISLEECLAEGTIRKTRTANDRAYLNVADVAKKINEVDFKVSGDKRYRVLKFDDSEDIEELDTVKIKSELRENGVNIPTNRALFTLTDDGSYKKLEQYTLHAGDKTYNRATYQIDKVSKKLNLTNEQVVALSRAEPDLLKAYRPRNEKFATLDNLRFDKKHVNHLMARYSHNTLKSIANTYLAEQKVAA